MNKNEVLSQLKSQSTWKLLILSVLTLGIYTAHYIKSQTKFLNNHLDASHKIKSGYVTFILIYTYITVVVTIAQLFVDEGHIVTLSDVLNNIWGFLVVIWAFKFRNRTNQLLKYTFRNSEWFSGALTFFFSYLYLNFKINKLNKNMQNQWVEPTVKTPVDLGNAQGTDTAHP